MRRDPDGDDMTISEDHFGFCEHCIEGGRMRSCPTCGLDLCPGCYGAATARVCRGCRRREDKLLRAAQSESRG